MDELGEQGIRVLNLVVNQCVGRDYANDARARADSGFGGDAVVSRPACGGAAEVNLGLGICDLRAEDPVIFVLWVACDSMQSS